MGYIPNREADLAVFTLNFFKYGEDKEKKLKFEPQEPADLRMLV